MASIAFLGDIALFGKNCILNNPDLKRKVLDLKIFLSSFDYVVANLEAPITKHSEFQGAKSVYIKSALENIEILKYLGVNAVSLANNHSYDYGYNGIEDTKKVLTDNNIDWFGIDGKYLKLNIKHQKVALHGYCSHNTNPSYGKVIDRFSKSGLNLLEYNEVVDVMHALDNEGYFNILSSHSGIENVSVPSCEDIKFSRLLAESMDYIYYGHHPHVIQGVEKHQDSVIAYSLGNCIFDDIYDHRTNNLLVKKSPDNSNSFVLSATIVDNKISSFSTTPFSFKDEVLIFNCKKSLEIIKERSDLLKLSDKEIIKLRNKELAINFTGLSSRRDLSWFFARLNISTLVRLFNNKVNAFLYKKKYKSFLNK